MQLTQEQGLSLSGNELDEAVALAQGWHLDMGRWLNQDNFARWEYEYQPSTNGSQCMEIMEREDISCRRAITDGNRRWIAYMGDIEVFGETAMIAICRCFVFKNWA